LISQEDYNYYKRMKAEKALEESAKKLDITVQEYKEHFGTSAITEAGENIDWSIT
jgi:hypothetical protein